MGTLHEGTRCSAHTLAASSAIGVVVRSVGPPTASAHWLASPASGVGLSVATVLPCATHNGTCASQARRAAQGSNRGVACG